MGPTSLLLRPGDRRPDFFLSPGSTETLRKLVGRSPANRSRLIGPSTGPEDGRAQPFAGPDSAALQKAASVVPVVVAAIRLGRRRRRWTGRLGGGADGPLSLLCVPEREILARPALTTGRG